LYAFGQSYLAQLTALDDRVTDLENAAPGTGGDDSHVDVDGGMPGADDANAGTGTGGVAIGSNAHSTGTGSVAVGSGSAATTASATAIGTNTSVQASGGTAIGAGATVAATATNSVALGQGSVADRANTVSVGSQGHERQVTNVAAGTADTDAANVAQVNAGDTRTLNDARAYTDARFADLVAAPLQAVDDLRSQVNKRFDETDERIDQMGAMNAAMLNMATSAAGVHQTNRVGVGVGFSGSSQALSIGYQRAIGEKITVTFGGAFSDDEASAGAGVGFGW
jgi:autotransporter adhesin